MTYSVPSLLKNYHLHLAIVNSFFFCYLGVVTPRYGININVGGKDILLGDPDINRVLIALMGQAAINNGAASHWGGPSAFAEIISILHHLYFRGNGDQDFNIVNDAGHAENGIYASYANYGFAGLTVRELLSFRSLGSRLTGHGEASKFKEGVLISNGPLGSALSQAQGVAFADKLMGRHRKTICLLSDGGCMEGEAKEALSSIPGLFSKNKLNPFLVIISDNGTKLMGPTDDAYNMRPFFESLDKLGWIVLTEKAGNDLTAVYVKITEAITRMNDGPIAIICKTVKGCRVRATETAINGGHGFPLKAYDPRLKDFIREIAKDIPDELMQIADELIRGRDVAAGSGGVKVQNGISRALIAAAKRDLPIFSITADLASSTGVGDFQKSFPDRFVDVGIAESNMLGMAVGLSKRGYIPIVDTFAQFGVTKGNLPLFMSALSQGPLIAIFSHAGMQDAADGASHQCTNYLSLTAAIPKVKAIVLATAKDAENYLTMAIDYFKTLRDRGEVPDSVVFFLGRENFVESLTDDYSWGMPQLLTSGDDLTLVTCGPCVHLAMNVYHRLKNEGIDITVINNCFVNDFISAPIMANLQRSGKLVTVEDHSLYLGMGSLLVHRLKLQGAEFKLASLGLNTIGESAYSSNELYIKQGIDAQSIYNKVKELLG